MLSEIAAPHDGLLPRLVQTLIATWMPWTRRPENAGQDPALAERLMKTTSTLSNHARQLEQIRNATARSSATALAPRGRTASLTVSLRATGPHPARVTAAAMAQPSTGAAPRGKSGR